MLHFCSNSKNLKNGLLHLQLNFYRTKSPGPGAFLLFYNNLLCNLFGFCLQHCQIHSF